MTVFLDDLQNFNEEYLLETYRDSTFMSETYFTEEEIERLQSLTIRGRTLKQTLDDLVNTRVEKDSAICSSHDLKPLYERYFGFEKVDMSKPKVKEARENWKTWRSIEAKEDCSTSSRSSNVRDSRDVLSKKIEKAKKKNRNREVKRLSLLMDG